MEFNENKQLENPCLSCKGSGEQGPILGENYPVDICGLCHGDKVVYPPAKENVKRPYLARY